MQVAYLALSLSHRAALSDCIHTLRQILHTRDIHLQVFVDEHHFHPEQEREMMQTAFAAIRSADLFIAEVSHKAIGVGVETGYAAALGKPILYLYRQGSEHSTTIGGTASTTICYNHPHELEAAMAPFLQQLG
ncbi:MAG: hypothetical protein GXC72_05610 [Chitinophagaceae bacterium]|nr:hypothetical protein [Chitinophagaceae bacterium]